MFKFKLIAYFESGEEKPEEVRSEFSNQKEAYEKKQEYLEKGYEKVSHSKRTFFPAHSLIKIEMRLQEAQEEERKGKVYTGAPQKKFDK